MAQAPFTGAPLNSSCPYWRGNIKFLPDLAQDRVWSRYLVPRLSRASRYYVQLEARSWACAQCNTVILPRGTSISKSPLTQANRASPPRNSSLILPRIFRTKRGTHLGFSHEATFNESVWSFGQLRVHALLPYIRGQNRSFMHAAKSQQCIQNNPIFSTGEHPYVKAGYLSKVDAVTWSPPGKISLVFL